MGPPVRTVCVACLQSLEISSEAECSNQSTCPYCGYPVALGRPVEEVQTSDGFASPPPQTTTETPRDFAKNLASPGQVGRFVLREPLGEGGYGQVFRAYDPHLDRDVALKILKPNRLNNKALERFLREARSAARLDHPNIVGLHDAGRDEGRCWIAYQLVIGQTLSALRDHDRPTIDASVRIVRDLALALHHAHERGVFHRDLKPANILIDREGRARLTDFGLARRLDHDSELTVEGTVLGTPHYMSPEAAAGRAHEADARSDVYSLGVILYELICGKRPSEVPSEAPLWRTAWSKTPPTPRTVDHAIPLELDRICMKALAFDREARYPNAIALASALNGFLKHQRQPTVIARPRPFRTGLKIGSAVAGLLLCVALGVRLLVPEPNELKQGRLSELPQPPKIDFPEPNTKPTPAVEPGTIHEVLKPVVPVDPELEHDWNLPVVWIKGTDGMKIHQAAGCQHLRLTAESRRIPKGDARSAVAKGYQPCKTCLNRLSLELDKRPSP